MIAQVNAWFVESSYGRASLLATVPPLIIVPRTEAWYKLRGSEYDLANDAIAVAKEMGYDGDLSDHLIFAYQGGPGNFQGQGSISGKTVWLRSITAGSCVHELGHNLGLLHANSWETSGQSIIGPGTNLEYGNGFDWMGNSRGANGDFNACWKNRIGWLKDEFTHQIIESGTYRVSALDQPELDPSRPVAFVVRRDGERAYWGEYRQRFDPANPSLRNGILLNWSPWSQSSSGTQLLDTTPGTPEGKNDAALTIGRTFSDPDAGVHITPVSKGTTSPEFIDVVVNIGAFADNRPPVVSVIASQTNFPPGETVQFTVAAIDPDGDRLSFFWDFGDGDFSTNNLPQVSKLWNTAGRHVVRCVVSDMKGGTASDSVLVTVGSPTNFFISGVITSTGYPVANVRVHNGLSGTQHRGTYTDSDGTYTLTGLPSGSTTLNAQLFGFSFTPIFANPVVVGPDFTGADLIAEEALRVSVTTLDAITTEGGDTATIRLSRTGPIGSELEVPWARLGGGTILVEFTFTPDFVFLPRHRAYGFVIPAGESFLDIVVAALDDGEIEGAEKLTMEIASTASYIATGENPATVTFLDSGSNLPVVSVEVVDVRAGESGDGAAFKVSRLGSTAGALVVQYDLSGSALNGTDYTALQASAVIPAGQLSSIIAISPINDMEIEGGENVILSLTANTNYLISPTAGEASAVILDDDVPTLSIVATDAAASETGQDPATFVVTRTGDTSAPLTVDYALSGSAQHGVDYAVLPGVITIPAGSSAGSITVVPIDDDIGEPSQTISVQIRGGTRYVVGNPGSATVSVADNDPPVVTVGVSDGSFGEPGDTGQFKFTTTGSGGGNITVHYTITGTATPGVDYVELSGTLSMGRNTTATVMVTPLDDSDPENLESVTVKIEADAAYSTFLDSTATLNLLDNEWNIVHVSSSSGYFTEANGAQLGFYISRQGPVTNALTVHYAMSGTASNGVDYVDHLSGVELPGSVTIPTGQAGTDVRARVINDSLTEGTETATLTLTSNAAYGLGIASATQYIPDDEVAGIEVGFASSFGGGSESVGTVNIPVMLNTTSAGPVTVEYSIAGGSATGGIDYNLVAGVLTFAPGVISMSVPLTIIDDNFDEPPQTVILALKNAWGLALGTSTYTYTISDNDSPPPVTVGFAATASAASENVSPAVVPVSISAVQPTQVIVHYTPTGGTATGGGGDYTLLPGTLTFAPGETVKFIPIPILDDTLNEPNETLIVTLHSPTGAVLNANTAHALTISNTAPVVRIRQIAVTGEGVALQLAGVPGLDYTIERSTDLESWVEIAVITAPPSGSFEFTDPNPSSTQAFYRTVTP